MRRKSIIEWLKTSLKKIVTGTLIAIVIGGVIVPTTGIAKSFLNRAEKVYAYEVDQHQEKKVIAIEAGHGIDLKTMEGDSGAIAVDGKFEAVRTMELSNILKKKLEEKGYEVILVRDGNYSMSLYEKQRVLNKKKPDLSLSIHFNSSENPNATGTEVLYNAKAKEAYGMDFINGMGKSISSRQKIPFRGSIPVGEKGEKGKRVLYTRNSRINSANLLLEVCFTSNKEDVEKYDSVRYLIAQNIADTIEKYI